MLFKRFMDQRSILLFYALALWALCSCEYQEPNLAYLYQGYKLPGLIEFGPIYGDKILPRKDDSSSTGLAFPIKFPFFNKEISQFYINTNGIISFDQKLATYDEISHSQDINFLSVFGSDIDTTYNGFIYHREIVDFNTLIYLSEFANKFVNLMDGDGNQLYEPFRASWGYLVTWHNVEPHRRYNELNNNTFQAVIFTDGDKSFSLFNYYNLTWPNSVLKSNIKIGINIDHAQNLLIENHQEAEFSFTKNKDILYKLVHRSNMNFERGRWLFRLDQRDFKLEEPFLRLDQNNGENVLQPGQIKTKIEDFNKLSYIQMGTHYGDTCLAKSEDGFTEIRLKHLTKLPLQFDKLNIIGRLFLHTNGLMTFDNELSYSGEISSEVNGDKRYIAPLWSDVDTRYNGDILYREMNDLDNLTRLFKDAQGYVEISEDFKPIWVFVASWVNVEPYRNKNPLLKNTFQMILFTDGTATYVYYQYFYLAWPSYDLPKNIQVGYNFNKKHSFIQKNFEFTKFSLNTSRLKSGKMLTELLYGSNMNQAGKWIYRLDKNGTVENLKNSSTKIPSDS